MPFHELIQIGETNGGVILPKSELRAEGLLDEDGNVIDGQQLKVNMVEQGNVRLLTQFRILPFKANFLCSYKDSY